MVRPTSSKRRGKASRSSRSRRSSVEKRLISSMQEAVAIKQGHAKPSREYTLMRTARDATATMPRQYNRTQIVGLRKRLGLSQVVFARVLGVSAATARSWEQDVSPPSGPARRLLEVVDKHPEIAQELVRVSGK